MNHQDFTPMVLRRTLTTEEKKKKGVLVAEVKHDAGKNRSSSTGGLDKRKVEAGLIGPPKTDRDFSLSIQQGRQKKNIARDKLAILVGVKEDVIKKLETPNTTLSGIDNLGLLVTKINKVLALKLLKPKATVLAKEEDKRTTT